jgi:hypothetical protein
MLLKEAKEAWSTVSLWRGKQDPAAVALDIFALEATEVSRK